MVYCYLYFLNLFHSTKYIIVLHSTATLVNILTKQFRANLMIREYRYLEKCNFAITKDVEKLVVRNTFFRLISNLQSPDVFLYELSLIKSGVVKLVQE